MATGEIQCPACGGTGQAAGIQRTSRYDFGDAVPGILFHVVFLLLVAIGVLFFTYVAGYTALMLWSVAATAVLAVWTFALLRRGYRVEEQLWRRCERCGRTWSTPQG